MATDHDISATASAHDAGPALRPLIDETPAEYLARLKALHARVGKLIDTIEQRKPALGPLPERPQRSGADRRDPAPAERRDGLDERRIGLPEHRSLPLERRDGPRERRSPMKVDRREDHIARRRDPDPVPWQRQGLRLDRTALVWALQIVAWVAIVAFALAYGIGR